MMKKISMLILLMYLGVMLNSLAFAQTALSISLMPLSKTTSVLSQDKQAYNCDSSSRIVIEESLRNFVQDLPQLQGYNWPKAEEEIKRSTAFLTKG